MRRALPLLIFALLAPSADAAYWHPASAPSRSAPLTVHPRRSSAYTVDLGAFRRRVNAGTVVRLPAPDGTLERFRVVPSAAMAPGRARRASGFHGFAGTGVDDPSASVRLDYSVLGVHASVRSRRGTWYVDPAYAGRTGRYLSYFGQSLRATVARDESPPVGELAGGRAQRVLPVPGAAVVRRTYRVALASDPSYATAVAPVSAGATLDAKVTAAKQTLISRVDQIYNDDLGIRLQLVATNKRLNFNTPSAFAARYSANDCDDDALDQNQDVIDDPSLIGTGNYDVGHLVFGPDGNGGGIAGLGVVGKATRKAEGCTGLTVPYGDAFAVDYVAHEMGHQFGGPHTFDGRLGSCAGTTRDASTAVEPGSGSSIMAYAGICSSDNLQRHSDPYFSQRSITNIQTYVTANPAQGGTTATPGNRSPIVTAPAPATVPIRTPFTLSGTATDADGNPLVFTWEQNDTGSGFTLGTNTRASGPLFRQFGVRSTETDADGRYYVASGENQAGAADAARSFPDPVQVAAGNTNAAGDCPTFSGTPEQIDCYSELLPTSPRTLKFRLTARDRDLAAGGVSAADTTVTVAGSAPFRVTSAFPSADPGVPVPVVWDVAGTNATPFNVSQVSIAYSTDGGLTFPTVLAPTTANDGLETVTIPTTLTTGARFRVAAVGAPFYDISHANMVVAPGGGAPTVPPSPPPPPPPPPPEDTPAPSPAPTASPTPAPTAAPAGAFLRPDLTRTARTVKVSSRRRYRLRIRCRAVGTYAVPKRCTVKLRVRTRRAPKTLADRTFAVAAGATRRVTLRLPRKAFRRLRGNHTVRATVRAIAGTRSTSRTIQLRR